MFKAGGKWRYPFLPLSVFLFPFFIVLKLFVYAQPLTYPELQHLLTLADVFDISNMDSQLRHILNQPISWFQSFVKALISKLPECCHLFSSPNGNTQELLILHPQYINGFVMIILNIQGSTVVSQPKISARTQ